MGWSSGTDIAVAVVTAVKAEVKDRHARKRIYKKFIKAMEDADWDTQDEAMDIDPVFDALITNQE